MAKGKMVWMPEEMIKELKKMKEVNDLKGKHENTIAAKLLIRHANQSQEMERVIDNVYKNYRKMQEEVRKSLKKK